MAHILVADTSEGAASLQRILEPAHELTIVSTMADALKTLKKNSFDLLIVGVRFDESRMFDFISAMRAVGIGNKAAEPIVGFEKNADRPIICFCARDTEMTRIMHDSIDFTSKALGAWIYLNQHEYNLKGDPDSEIRRVLERCLTVKAQSATLAKQVDIHKHREKIQRIRLTLMRYIPQPEDWQRQEQQWRGRKRQEEGEFDDTENSCR
jgi:hypothetical protein